MGINEIFAVFVGIMLFIMMYHLNKTLKKNHKEFLERLEKK